MTVTIEIDVEKEIDNVMFDIFQLTEDALKSSRKLNDLVNVDFVAGVAIGELFLLRALLLKQFSKNKLEKNAEFSISELTKLSARIDQEMADIKSWGKRAKTF